MVGAIAMEYAIPLSLENNILCHIVSAKPLIVEDFVSIIEKMHANQQQWKKEQGVTRENRCTSHQNGNCISPEGIPLCDCFPGYVGEKCDIYDPCARNPCGRTSECIAIPDEMEVKGDLSAQNYRCICGMAEDLDA
ncbi:unnamed protein product [Strongylus vulgaris]|uniref:EGF-like domain-containing protein n=1 Tax=Strongylus vulgaris TaxID=40348 RepID=A0A3P7JEL1_STRVU|nr:unnamed protein product [Strongylus vulgaris]